MDASSTDHLPIIAEVNFRVQQAKNKTKIHKRYMKNVTQQKWTVYFAGKEWEDLVKTEDVNKMAQYFNNRLVKVLDECALWKNIKNN